VFVVLSYDPTAPSYNGHRDDESIQQGQPKKRKTENPDEINDLEVENGDNTSKLLGTTDDKPSETTTSLSTSDEDPRLFFGQIPSSRSFLVTASHSNSSAEVCAL
jgi:hypothetical protein